MVAARVERSALRSMEKLPCLLMESILFPSSLPAMQGHLKGKSEGRVREGRETTLPSFQRRHVTLEVQSDSRRVCKGEYNGKGRRKP